jgi:hypothetical protein
VFAEYEQWLDQGVYWPRGSGELATVVVIESMSPQQAIGLYRKLCRWKAGAFYRSSAAFNLATEEVVDSVLARALLLQAVGRPVVLTDYHQFDASASPVAVNPVTRPVDLVPVLTWLACELDDAHRRLSEATGADTGPAEYPQRVLWYVHRYLGAQPEE